jgi:hypothetical protein
MVAASHVQFPELCTNLTHLIVSGNYKSVVEETVIALLKQNKNTLTHLSVLEVNLTDVFMDVILNELTQNLVHFELLEARKNSFTYSKFIELVNKNPSLQEVNIYDDEVEPTCGFAFSKNSHSFSLYHHINPKNAPKFNIKYEVGNLVATVVKSTGLFIKRLELQGYHDNKAITEIIPVIVPHIKGLEKLEFSSCHDMNDLLEFS